MKHYEHCPHAYDNANQMTGITDKNSSGTTLVSYGYTYDAAGLVSQETRTWASGSSTDTLTYGYTNNDQLTSVTHTNSSFSSESFSYDANGNETGTGFTTSTNNEQTASPGYTYTYDADGNMITMTQTSTGDVWTYSYNFRNLMTGAVEKTSTGTVLAQVTYTYDALDNRIGMDENGTQTWTLYDGSDPVMDFNSSGSLEMRYLNGPTGDLVDTVIARESAGGTIAWYLPDRLGTIRDLINNSGGVIDHVDYSAFGTQLDESSPSNGDRMMGFAGMERDTVTGLNLAVNRVQNPGTGRWDTQDPKSFTAGDADLYRYVENAPTNFSDRTGLLIVPPRGPDPFPPPLPPGALPAPPLNYPLQPNVPAPKPNIEYDYDRLYDYQKYLSEMAEYYGQKYNNYWWGMVGNMTLYFYPNSPYSVNYVSYMCYSQQMESYYRFMADQWADQLSRLQAQLLERALQWMDPDDLNGQLADLQGKDEWQRREWWRLLQDPLH
jgi:RHS repeat-associated protein